MITTEPFPPDALWDAFLDSLGDQISNHVVETWLRPVQCLAHQDGECELAVRDRFSRDWLTDHYQNFVKEGLSAILKHPVHLKWSIRPELYQTTDSCQAAPPEEPIAASNNTPETERSGTQTAKPPRTALPLGSEGDSNHLNDRYTFDQFVGGPSNQFAFAAAKAVAANPGASYNPLFLFGGVGLGKTHLLTGIGHQVLRDRLASNVIYTSAEQFSNDVVNAVLKGRLEDFRLKYRGNTELLLIDDIQLLAGKERTQHELFHIFNTLYDTQKQIVVTSDKLPHELPEIEERLRNRFQWGLIADVQPPEIETRIAIILQKANKEGVELPEDVALFLAKSIRSNVRELEGALVRVIAHASLTQTRITEDHARRILADILPGQAKQLTVESIQKLVASYFQVRVADLKSRGRQKAIVRPRQIAMYLCRKHAGASFPDLGDKFGKKDHTTVMSACKKIDLEQQRDPSLRSQISDLERQLDVVTHT